MEGWGNINAGNDTTVIGANINGAGGVNIHGGNNTNILAAYDIKEKIDTKTVKSNDFGRFMDTLHQSATNPHITPIHTPTDTYSNNIDSSRTAVLTNINGGSGNVSLTAGNTLTLQAPIINGASYSYGGDKQTNLLQR
ncbi:MAG: hemagglutinin repeat-containing protein [Polaromonas sp.]|nr:hemagglutinin repeat-containing protein [Polaromonas sp.]